MTAQHHTPKNHAEQPDVQQPVQDGTDPLGPIMLPKRSKVGARAMALVGTVGLSAFAAAAAANVVDSTWPTI
ncbi:hypothetical protein ACIBL3_35860 [Kribbella sp. NPDC050124]|uniref:hypothetical protein n=1 Tax=Kribbella sp. NPDC050124 TaxID=3364114 RepID=UPI0037960B64